MDENITNSKYSNVSVSDTTRIGDLNFSKFTNIAYVNNVLHSKNNIITLSESNTTYLISDTNENTKDKKIYITSVDSLDKDIFTSKNHNLKKGDIIKIKIDHKYLSEEIKTNFIYDDNDEDKYDNIQYKVINVSRNTFNVITYDSPKNIKNIVNRTIKNIPNCYFQYSNTSDLTYTTNRDIIVNIPSNNTDDLGVNYNIIINTDIDSIKIDVLNDTLEGKINIISNGIANNLIYTGSNKKYIMIKDIDLLYSSFELINISKNNWFLNAFIYSNTIKYKLVYEDDIYKYKNKDDVIVDLIEKNFYKKFIYEFDVSDPSLKMKIFRLLDSNKIEYNKNVVKFGELGYANSLIKFYLEDSLLDNSLFSLRFKKLNDTIFTDLSFFRVQSDLNLFY